MTDLRAFGNLDRPLILDVSQLARRVLWGTSDLIGVLQFRSTYTGTSSSEYAATLRALPFGTTWNLNSTIREPLPFTVPPIVDETKISRDMRNKLLLWSYVPNKLHKTEVRTLTSEVIDRARYIGYVSGGFPLYGGEFASAEEAYTGFRTSFFQTFGRYPDPGNPSDLFVGLNYVITSHTETTTQTFHTRSIATDIFLNLSLIAKTYLPLKNPKLTFQIVLGSGTNKEGIFYDLSLTTWRNNLAFPVKRLTDSDGFARMVAVGWDVTKLKDARGFQKIGGGDFPAMPLTTVTFEIDCVTLQITKAQRTP